MSEVNKKTGIAEKSGAAYIRADKLCYTYEKSGFSLTDISADFSAGCFTALRGKNGSGKTTLGKLLVGLLQPSTGEITINGVNAAGLTLGERGRQLGYLFQNPSQQIFAPMVKEELCFIPRLLGWTEEDIAVRCEELLDFFALTHIADSVTFYLSRGEKQRLALAGMLFMRPPYLILDEPTTGLDRENRSNLADILHRLLDEGVGMTVISHDSAFLERFPDKESITMSEGHVVG